MKNVVIILSFLLFAVAAYGDPSDSLTELTVKKAVNMILLQDQTNRLNEQQGRPSDSKYVININIDTAKWIEERGGTQKILTADDFNKMSEKLITFNKRPDNIRCYVIVINDYYVKFKARVDSDIIGDNFKWNDLEKFPEQDKAVSLIKTKTRNLINEISNGLEASGFTERIIYFYSQLIVEEYNANSHFYKYDKLRFIGKVIETYQAEIRSHVKIPSQGAVTNIDNAISSIINSTEAVIDKGYKTPPDNLVDLKNAADHSLPGNDFSKIPEAEFKNFASLVDVAVGKPEAGWDLTKEVTDYRHINNIEILKRSVRDGNRNFDIEVLEDKFHNLQDKTGVKFFVVAGPFWNDLNREQANQFAEQVFKQSKLKDEKKVILITLPFYNKSVVNKASLASDPYTDISVVSPGIYAAGVDLDLTMVNNTVEQNDLYPFVMNAYKFLAKPYTCHIYSIPANERISYLTGKSEANVKGMEAMDELIILRDRNIDEFKKFDIRTQPDIEKYLIKHYTRGSAFYSMYDTDAYQRDLAKYYDYLKFYLEHISNPDWEFLSDSRKLKEPYIADHKDFVAQFFETTSPFLDRVKANWGSSALDGKTYDFKVVANYVKPELDKLWFIPLVPNVTGWIWAESEGDYVIADGYAQSTTIELTLTVLPVGEALGMVFSKVASTGVVKVAAGKFKSILGLQQSSKELADQALQKLSTLGLTEAEEAEARAILQEQAVAAFVGTSQSKIALQSFTKKEVFMLYLRQVAELTGVKDLTMTIKLFAHIASAGIDGFYTVTSTRLLPLLTRDKALDFTTTLVQAPVYGVHCIAYSLKAAKEFMSFETFNNWITLQGIETSVSLTTRKQIYDEVQDEIVVALRAKVADDDAIINLLERFPYPKQLNTLLEKAGSATNLNILFDNLIPLSVNKSQVYAVISRLSKENVSAFVDDMSKNSMLIKKLIEKPEWVDGWDVLRKSDINNAIRININKLEEINGLLKNNNLGWQRTDFENFLKRPIDKPWDNVDEVITALKRTSDANVSGLNVSYKKFPQPKDGSYSYVLDNAKKYQGGLGYDMAGNIVKGSGDANLSFDYNGVSFDDVRVDGTLIDRKFGQGNSIFDKIIDEFDEIDILVKNDSRAQSLMKQAERQITAGNGKPIRWEISTELGANGIRQLFTDINYTQNFPGIDFTKIDVVWIKP